MITQYLIIESIKKLIRVADNNVKIEIDYETNAEQLELMRQTYEGKIFEIDGIKICFKVITLIEYDQQIITMKMVMII